MPSPHALFVQYDAQLGGSPISGLMVVGALVEMGWRVDAVFASPGPMTERYEQLGCRIHVLPHGQWLGGGHAWRKAKRWIRELSALCGFVKLMRHLKPDLVYVNNLTGFAAVAAARLMRTASVWHIRELFDDVGGEMRPPLGGKALARWAVARLPSRVVAISHAVAENVLGATFPLPLDGRGAGGVGACQSNREVTTPPLLKSPRVVIIPNAVGSEFFDENRTPAECRALFGLPGRNTSLPQGFPVGCSANADCPEDASVPVLAGYATLPISTDCPEYAQFSVLAEQPALLGGTKGTVAIVFDKSLASPAGVRPPLSALRSPLIGVPGTLRPVKGHEFFFAAARRVREQLPECHFAVTGTGPAEYRSRLEAQVAQAGLKDCTHFLGPVADMPAFYRACDVVCIPSRSESFGRTVVEAFVVGTPVVATSVGGMRETIEHEKTGLLVEYGDVEGLASALLRLLADRPLAHRLATTAREEASKSYSEEVYKERIRALVEEFVRQSHT